MRIESLRSVRGVVIASVVASGMVMGCIGYATFQMVHHEIERQLDHRIELETDALLSIYANGGLEGLLVEVRNRDQRLVPGRIGYLVGASNEGRAMGVFVVDAQGRRLAGSLRADTPPPGWSEFLPITRTNGSKGFAQAMNSDLANGNRLVVAADRAILEDVGFRLQKMFLFGLGLILIVCAAAAVGVGRFVQVRLGNIQATAEGIMAGDFQRRIPLDNSGSEFDRLSRVLNAMLDRISSLLSNLKEVSENIAHDMRTPLHRLRYQLEVSEREEQDETQRQRLRESLSEADELLDLFSSLLAISEIEGFKVRDRFRHLDLGGAVREIVEAYMPALKTANLDVSLQIEPVWVRGDRRLLQQCMANFLDNILSHAKGATQVSVWLRKSKGGVVLSVGDNGPGIAESDRARIFERFVRLDQARTTPGHGLGLSLVAAIAAAHHGAVSAVSLQPGLCVEFWMHCEDAP